MVKKEGSITSSKSSRASFLSEKQVNLQFDNEKEKEKSEKRTDLVKPLDQLALNKEDLHEDILKALKANNPMPSQLVVRFHYRDKCFRPAAQLEQLIIDFKVEGNYIHVDSDEAKIQFERIRTNAAVRDRYIKMRSMDVESSSSDFEDEEDEAKKKKKKKKSKKVVKKAQKKFDLNSRSTQTMNNYMKDCETITQLPPSENFSDNATLDRIHDSYVADFEAAELKRNARRARIIKRGDRFKMTSSTENEFDVSKMFISAMFIERMTSQNTNEEITEDFKYYEDKADDFRVEGSLLPLWKFSYEGTKNLAIAAMTWIPKYSDAFVCGYGSFNFCENPGGLIACFTLKNTSYPFISFKTDFGVMSLDINTEVSHYLAAGFFDGSIAIYNLADVNSYPVFSKGGNHRDPVWQIQWDKKDIYGFLTLFSISSDGRVVKWTMKKNELYPMNAINFKEFNTSLSNDLLGNLVQGSGTCFEFNKQNDLLFLVGTEEGKIHVCSKIYYNSVLETYDAHSMSVYAVRWNPFYSKYFITCSADWTIKVWELGLRNALETFDLGSPVADCVWAPFSSSVFAGITADGRIVIYDLNVKRMDPLVEQYVSTGTRKRKLTRIAFSPSHPIIIVGDDKGYTRSFKLSPNLRRKPKEIIRKDLIVFEGEISKLERILSSFTDQDFVYTKLSSFYEIVRPKETQHKRLEMMSQKDDVPAHGDSKKKQKENFGSDDERKDKFLDDPDKLLERLEREMEKDY